MYDHKDGIRLRKISRDDLRIFLALKKESWWGTHNTLIVNIDDQIEWYENIPHNEIYMTVEKRWSGSGDDYDSYSYEVVGIAGYTDIDWCGRTLNISGSIVKKHRINDIVRPSFSAGLDFAFEILNMQRVGAEVLECNPAAQSLEIGHLGFIVEGQRRRAVYKSGRYYDSIQLGLLREEWEEQERVKSYKGCCNINFDHKLASKVVTRHVQRMSTGHFNPTIWGQGENND